MPGRVLVTGASGFVGSAVVEALLARGYGVNALVNHRALHETSANIRVIKGNLFDTAAVDDGVRDADAVIHLVGIIMEKPSKGITFERIHFEGTKAIVDAAARNGVKRYLHMSALGSRPNAVSRYHQTKFLAEQYVRASPLDWTIFRPSLIHGPRGEFMQMEAKWARSSAPPFVAMPYFGGKKAGRLQPVFVNDVARGFVDALEKAQTIREIYPLGGPDVLSWPELHRTCAQAIVGHRRWVLSMPVWLAKFATCVTPPALLPFNRDQVIMSQEDNTADLAKFKADFGWEPVHFAPTLKEYASKL
jgi:NADH dehydrogenase